MNKPHKTTLKVRQLKAAAGAYHARNMDMVLSQIRWMKRQKRRAEQAGIKPL